MAVGQDRAPGDRGARPAGQHRRFLSPGLAWALLWFGLLPVVGCGYGFSVGQGRLPDGGQRLCIPVADSRTADAWSAPHLTRALRLAAERAGLATVAGEAPRLEARIASIDALPRAVSVAGGRYRTREQEVQVVVEMSLALSDGRAWKRRYRERESYLSAPDIRGTEANRQQAIRTVLDGIAADAIGRLSRQF